MQAVEIGNEEIIKMLLDKGAKLLEIDRLCPLGQS
jgi:hypothetical protein